MRAIILLCVLAAACPASEWTKSFSISGKAELRVDTNDAPVRVRAVPTTAIEARVTTEGWRLGGDEVRITEHQTGNRVELDVRIPRFHFTIGHRLVRIEVLVPQDTAVDVHTGDGSVTLEGTRGSARAITGDGSITTDRLDGSLEARTGDGRIVARGRFDSLILNTGDGSVEADAAAGSKMASSWRVQTGDGSVTLRVPSDLAADLDVHTGDGSIQSNLTLTVNGQHRKNELRGKLNGGGPTITVRTGDGSVHLGRL